MKKIFEILLISIFALTATSFKAFGADEVFATHKILIKVQPNYIVMTAGAKTIPVDYARIRSTGLREANKTYNAVSIERVYTLQEKVVDGKPVIVDGETIHEEVETPDTFILTLQDYRDEQGNLVEIDIDKAVLAYTGVSVVILAQKQ